jgi:hypothetical protein
MSQDLEKMYKVNSELVEQIQFLKTQNKNQEIELSNFNVQLNG